jgi:hypothetical protein
MMNGLRKCGIIYNGILFSHEEKRKFSLLLVNEWNWRTSSSVNSAMFRKQKAICFLSYVEYRPNINTSSIMENRSYLTITYGGVRVKEGS